MGKKVGIITLYYKNRNYGGSLQAYALCRFLTACGLETEQISYQRTKTAEQTPRMTQRLKRMLNPKNLYNAVAVRVRRLGSSVVGRAFHDKLKQRYDAIDWFDKHQTPHSETVYTEQTIQNCDGYDAYITGSDQVWNPAWSRPAYFLSFVPKGKPKISYAASVGVSTLTETERGRIQKHLADFTAVSVREEDAVDLLSPVSPVPVEWVLDPTMLLTREQWDEICSERLVAGKYIFTYFLGEDMRQRKLAADFAKQKGMPIVTLPHIHGNFRLCDLAYGDKKLYAVSPADFISLIKYAEYVLTDSFHGTVFSNIYEREYFVFPRKGRRSMGTRIYSLTKLMGREDRFCDTAEKCTLSYVQSLAPMDYNGAFLELESCRMRSKKFLEKALGVQL